jgi:hypothetical protein
MFDPRQKVASTDNLDLGCPFELPRKKKKGKKESTRKADLGSSSVIVLFMSTLGPSLAAIKLQLNKSMG